MKQSAKQSEEKRVVGLASENKLPDAFKAKTNEDAGTVELRKPNHRSVDIGIGSYQAVANLLDMFAQDGEPSLDPGATITITDNFSNKSTTITANTFVDVAAVFHAFIVRKGRYKPPTEIAGQDDAPAEGKKSGAQSKSAVAAPAAQESVAAEPPKEVPSKIVEESAVPAEEKTTTPVEPPTKAVQAAKAPSKPKSSPTKKAEPAAGGEASKKVAASTPAGDENPAKQALSTFPVWARKALELEYEDAVWGFKFVAASLSLTENGKTVLGRDDGNAEHKGSGYEVLIHGRHAGWIVVEGETSFYLTGIENYESTRHRNIDPAIKIRIRRVIYPLLGHPAPDGV